jgi:hypothetical protein
MEIFFIDAGVVSVFAGRENASDWGARMASTNVELWFGKTYVCATFDRRKSTSAARLLAVAALAFTIGWVLDPPEVVAKASAVLFSHSQHG